MRRNGLRHIINTGTFWLPLRWLARMAPGNLVMPFWHCVSDETLPHLRYLYRIPSAGSFRRDLDRLLRTYQPVSAADVLDHVAEGRSFASPSMLISFDDGLRQVHETVAPLLRGRGIPAVFFINSGFVGNRGLFYRYQQSILVDRLCQLGSPEGLYEIVSGHSPFPVRGLSELVKYVMGLRYDEGDKINELASLLEVDFASYLKIKKPYMTEEQVASLVQWGFEVGAHSIDHPLFAGIPLEEQLRQVQESIGYITGRFGQKTAYFAFPFTDDGVGEEFFERVFQKDHRLADLCFATAGIKKDPVGRNLQRVPADETALGAGAYLRTEYILYALKKLAGRHEVKR